ncbi:hypothetical protein [Roseibium algae]|uniref:2-oxoglutarate-Fe(II)-dependent oxygenase superfamily protein n=1 Tax=Roseibium algae TaxID=3123038 RepID=A0ABU8TKK3_9HYPH
MAERLLLHATHIGYADFDETAQDCQSLFQKLLDLHPLSDGESGPMNSLERRVSDVLDLPEAIKIKTDILAAVAGYMGDWWAQSLPVSIENRALIIQDYGHISTHSDSREGDVTAVYFLTGQNQDINTVGNPRFVIEDERLRLDEQRMPWEGRHGFSVCPKPGRCIIFPSRVPHNQHPFRAGPDRMPHMQIVANFKFDNLPDPEDEV